MQSVNKFETTNKVQVLICQSDISIIVLYLNSLCKNGLPQCITFKVNTDIDTSFDTSIKPFAIINNDLFIKDINYNDNEDIHLPISGVVYNTSLPNLNDIFKSEYN